MKSFLVAGLTGAITQVAADGKCRALAFSSGDEDAAYQAGVMKGITTSTLSPEEYQYDSISGVAGGAINAVLFAEFAKGNEGAASDRMEQFWVDASHSTLYKNWFGGIATGLFLKGGLYNAAPLQDFLKKEFGNTSINRMLNIGITDIKDGSYKDFTEQNITAGENLLDALQASMTFAGFFPPADVLGSSYFEGSAVWDVDIFSAINKCIDQGFSEQDIIVDVILTSAANLKQVTADDYKSVQMLFRYLEISSFYNSMDGLLRAKFAYQNVNFRYVIAPSGNIPSSI
jgi:hypothetical protein